MRVFVTRMVRLASVVALLSLATSCQTSAGDRSTEGSEPANESEAVQYKKALLRCYKTGGTRIVKISGVLRCY